MKITLAFVTLAALVCMASGAGLRRVESEVSVAMQNKVSAFMMIYGDALRHAPEYHKHPVEYLKKFAQGATAGKATGAKGPKAQGATAGKATGATGAAPVKATGATGATA